MPSLFQNLLTLHVILGVSATGAFGYAWMQFKNPEYKTSSIKTLSLLGTLALFASWITGGYYYLYWYGSKVKPLILAGSQPWAHRLIMEAKEHIFLIMPFVALASIAIIYLLGDKFETDLQVKKSASALLSLNAILGIVMIIMGIIISGAR